jgi:hypothetical protein
MFPMFSSAMGRNVDEPRPQLPVTVPQPGPAHTVFIDEPANCRVTPWSAHAPVPPALVYAATVPDRLCTMQLSFPGMARALLVVPQPE